MLELLLSRSCAQDIYRMLDARACASPIRPATWHLRSQSLTDFKQLSRVWYEVLHFYFKKFDFDIIEFDHNVFVSKHKKYYIVVYVNDLLIFEVDIKYINIIKIRLNQRFEMIDFDFAQHYLKIEMIKEEDFIFLRQTTYLKKILKRFEMNKCFSVNLSIKSKFANVLIFIKKDQQTNDDIMYWYESTVDNIMYVATNIRSNIMFAICLLNKFCSNFDFIHMIVLQRLFKCIQNILFYDIEYAFDEQDSHDFVDANWTENVEDRRFTNEYVFFIDDDAIFWVVKRQDLVALFNCEFEYYALNEIDKKVKWLRFFLFEFDHIDEIFVQIWTNNQETIVFSKNFEFHKRIKHIDVK